MLNKDLSKQNTYVLSRGTKRIQKFSSLSPIQLTSISDIRRKVESSSKQDLWISFETALTDAILRSVDWSANPIGKALLVHHTNPSSFIPLNRCFRQVAFCGKDEVLPDNELSEVLSSDNSADLFIGGTVDNSSKTLTLWRGNLKPFTVPFSAFPASGDGVSPDFSKFKIEDYGQTIQLGEYEASSDSVLYENDSKYRKKIKQNQLQADKSFGGSIRRLRLQRKLSRDDFPPLDARTIARIELGKVKNVRPKTRDVLSKILKVKPEQLDQF